MTQFFLLLFLMWSSEIRWRVKEALAGRLTYDGGGKIDSALRANFDVINLVPPGPFYPRTKSSETTPVRLRRHAHLANTTHSVSCFSFFSSTNNNLFTNWPVSVANLQANYFVFDFSNYSLVFFQSFSPLLPLDKCRTVSISFPFFSVWPFERKESHLNDERHDLAPIAVNHGTNDRMATVYRSLYSITPTARRSIEPNGLSVLAGSLALKANIFQSARRRAREKGTARSSSIPTAGWSVFFLYFKGARESIKLRC